MSYYELKYLNRDKFIIGSTERTKDYCGIIVETDDLTYQDHKRLSRQIKDELAPLLVRNKEVNWPKKILIFFPTEEGNKNINSHGSSSNEKSLIDKIEKIIEDVVKDHNPYFITLKNGRLVTYANGNIIYDKHFYEMFNSFPSGSNCYIARTDRNRSFKIGKRTHVITEGYENNMFFLEEIEEYKDPDSILTKQQTKQNVIVLELEHNLLFSTLTEMYKVQKNIDKVGISSIMETKKWAIIGISISIICPICIQLLFK